ncbi:MAG TPA: isoleucine--tRNA ligase [Acidobacteriota bacterium]
MANEYRDTLNLPRTEFPMKANLPQREPELLRRWQEMDLYRQIRERRAGLPAFLLHDGPPYANGHVHLGTALNKVLKDFVVRTKNMQALNAVYVPGWDCHGMPIEHQVMREAGAEAPRLSKLEIRGRCRDFARKFIGVQRDEFQRLGVMGDWEHPYLTLDPDYEAEIVRAFRDLVQGGYIYRGLRSIQWCGTCKTALADAEVEYYPHTSPSITVAFPVAPDDPVLARTAKGYSGAAEVLIWTTTPWTLPANLAIAVHPEHDYVWAELAPGRLSLVAAERLAAVAELLGGSNPRVHARIKGRELEGLQATHPVYGRPSPLVLGSHVTLDQGTGCVHTAPGHGPEDFALGQQYGLPIFCPVDEAGRFTAEVETYAGRKIEAANPDIITELDARGALRHRAELEHSYPHCWRCKQPLLFRATEQWFLNVDHERLRERARAEIEKTRWVPKWGHDRIANMVEVRPDWCLSRQRAWGVAIPAFYCRGCKAPLLEPELIGRVADRIAQDGSDVWFSAAVDELIGPQRCASCGGREFTKEEDIFDVWFDASCSQRAVLGRGELGWPADLYLEATDQHRGWFQVSLLNAVAVRGQAPFREVLTHGLILDPQGRKMSKSLGNVVQPENLIREHGADILRLFFAAMDTTADIPFSARLLQPVIEGYRKVRNTLRYLLGNLGDFDPAADRLPFEELVGLDRWALDRLRQTAERVVEAYNRYQFYLAYQMLRDFCIVDLSALYLDVLKDRLYVLPRAAQSRRSAQSVLYELADGLIRLLAPILPFTAEEAWTHLPSDSERSESVHLAPFPEVGAFGLSDAERQLWQQLLQVRSAALKALEQARQSGEIGSGLEARVVLGPPVELEPLLLETADELRFLLIVSQVELGRRDGAPAVEQPSGLKVWVERAGGEKCARCWNYSEDVGRDTEHPTLCERCVPILRGEYVA